MICTIKNGIGKLDGVFSGIAESAILKFSTPLKSDVTFDLMIGNTLMSFMVQKGLTEYYIPIRFEIDTSIMSIESNVDLTCAVEIV